MRTSGKEHKVVGRNKGNIDQHMQDSCRCVAVRCGLIPPEEVRLGAGDAARLAPSPEPPGQVSWLLQLAPGRGGRRAPGPLLLQCRVWWCGGVVWVRTL